MNGAKYCEVVTWFGHRMVDALVANDDKGGWDDCSPEYLCDRLRQEVAELEREARNAYADLSARRARRVIEEAADVANFAMMIAEQWRTIAKEEP